jgi:hypothetical protein
MTPGAVKLWESLQQSWRIYWVLSSGVENLQRNVSELPGLKRFRNFCFVCMGVSFIGLLIVDAITFSPQIKWLMVKAHLLPAIVTLYFLIIGLRTQVMISQLSRNHRQTFARPAPEWITVCFLLCAVIVVVWPHSR